MPHFVAQPFTVQDFRRAMLPGLRAVREVWRPFVLVLLGAAAVVVSYYHVAPVAHALEHVADLKARWGYAFSMVAGVLAGVVVAEAVKRLTLPGHRILRRWREWALDAVYFAIMAVLCDALYRFLAAWLGAEPTVRNVIVKTLIDQFVFTPTLGVTLAANYFPVREHHWDWRAVLEGFGPAWYVRRVLPLLVTAWCFWLPMVTLVYTMPPLLQFPFSACGTAAWSLLMISITRRRISEAAPVGVVPGVVMG